MDFLAGQDVLSYLRENSVVVRPQLVLILWGLAILCVVPLLHKSRTTYPFVYAVIGLLVAGLDIWWGTEAGPAFNGMITFDFFTRYFHIIFVVTALITVLLSYRYLEIENEHHGEYYALILFATAGMMFVAGALELITILVGLELMSVSTYILVGFLRGRRRSNEAAMKYFLLGAFSTGMILYGMSLLYGITGTTNLVDMRTALARQDVGSLLVLGVLLMIIGLCFKVAAAPFHMWVPDAYEGAPTAVTAFMSVGVKAAAFALFFRVCFVALGDVRETYVLILALVSMLTMTWGNLAAVTQTNLKRLFAYSSISPRRLRAHGAGGRKRIWNYSSGRLPARLYLHEPGGLVCTHTHAAGRHSGRRYRILPGPAGPTARGCGTHAALFAVPDRDSAAGWLHRQVLCIRGRDRGGACELRVSGHLVGRAGGRRCAQRCGCPLLLSENSGRHVLRRGLRPRPGWRFRPASSSP